MLTELRARIVADPIAVKMSYPDRMEAKLARLQALFPNADGLEHFFAAILTNTSVKISHLDNMLGFVPRLPHYQLFAWLWPQADEVNERLGLSEDRPAREALRLELAARCDLIRRFTKAVPVEWWDVRPVARALRIPLPEAMELVAQRPRLVRGLRKPLRPIYACLPPLLLTLPLATTLPYPVLVLLIAAGTWFLSMRCALAPGVLWNPIVRRCLREGAKAQPDEFHRARRYENGPVRIDVRDKRTPEGALQFLTSSEEIGNCIALRSFVSWTLPALLEDESVVLADVSVKNQPRAQVWMVAARREGRRVLCVNSIECNNEGAKHLEVIMPEVVAMLRDVARRAGFAEIYVGVTNFGRGWLDARFSQGTGRILKPGPHRRCHFDSFRRGEFQKTRSLTACAYALLCTVLELRRNRAKALAFLDSARNRRNCWKIDLT